jgi:hypothetical protein
MPNACVVKPRNPGSVVHRGERKSARENRVALISTRLWQGRFGAATPEIVGK